MIRRTKTLVVFNTWVNAKTVDGKTSKECADAYANMRGYCSGAGGIPGQYWKLGFDFGGKSIGPAASTQTIAYFGNLICAESFAPGQNPEVNNPRYTGQTMIKAVSNMVADGQLDAIFVESLVPNYTPQTTNYAPEGWFISMLPLIDANPSQFGGNRGFVTDRYSDVMHTLANPALNKWITNNRKVQLPWGRIGWPGCTFADIQRLAKDANWGESQNNLVKKHIVGGTNYTAGGDTAHMILANQSFAKYVSPANLGAFTQDGSYANHKLPGAGFSVDWAQFDAGTITPPLDVFGMLFSLNPSTLSGKPKDASSWIPMRGAWSFDWCSGSTYVGYDNLRDGGTASILAEREPFVQGCPATDCVAAALVYGLTVAEANFLSDKMQTANHSVYGAPDYAPYWSTSDNKKQIYLAMVNAFLADFEAVKSVYNIHSAEINAAIKIDPTSGELIRAVAACAVVANALNASKPSLLGVQAVLMK